MRELSAVCNRAPSRVFLTRWVRSVGNRRRVWLAEGRDGLFYVVKWANGERDRRRRVSELFTSTLARDVGISTPRASPALAPPQPRKDTGEPASESIVLATEYAADPQRCAIFDHPGASVGTSVSNQHEELLASIFDAWISNCDERQFVLSRSKKSTTNRYWLHRIDHSGGLSGPEWRLAPLSEFSPLSAVDAGKWQHGELLLDQISTCAETSIAAAYRAIPETWLPGQDMAEFQHICGALARRARLLGAWYRRAGGGAYADNRDHCLSATAKVGDVRTRRTYGRA